MKIKKFRIQNFKSINDSGYCTFASDLTILVGKNESGKSATLEALRYFNRDIQRVPDEAYPIDGLGKEPQVEICFSLDRLELEEIQKASGVQLADKAIRYIMKNGLTVFKDSRGRYHLSEDGIKELFNHQPSDLPIEHIKSAKERLQQLLKSSHFPTIDYESSNENIQKQSKDFIKVVKSFLPSVKDEQTQMEVVQAIRVIVKESVELTGLPSQQPKEALSSDQIMNAAAFFVERFVERLPRFIYFKEFTDVLPFEVPITELKNNQAVLDFAKVSGLDLDYFIETQDVQKRINFLNRHSTHISGNFLEYWGQDKIELIVKSEGDCLLFGALEHGKAEFFKVEQRSKGFQWFLSFYLRIKAQRSDHNIIIIDEPGTHLHANTQKEILKVLEKEVNEGTQVIFSTHCPYLIDPKRLDRIRLVLKDQLSGTKIYEDIHHHANDESMAPVMTAMSSGKSNTTLLSSNRNIIVGSVHDFYFWKAMKLYMNGVDHLSEIILIPAVDADHAQQLIATIIAGGLDFQILLNHNNTGWKVGQHLKEKFGFEDEKITYVSEKLGYFTEDLFTPEDFKEFILEKEIPEDQAMLNSTFLKNNSLNKVLLARAFYEKVEQSQDKIALSDTTVAAFQSVFEKIIDRFYSKNVEDVRSSDPNLNAKPEPHKPKGGVKRRSLFAFLRKK